MKVTNIALARATLERIRVKAIHNEFSGAGRYHDKNTGCLCVIGSIMPPSMFEVAAREHNGSPIDGFYVRRHGAEGLELASDALARETGIPSGMLASLQIEHDQVSHQFGPGPGTRAVANKRIAKWATTTLSTLF
jgi:hypothetical protein